MMNHDLLLTLLEEDNVPTNVRNMIIGYLTWNYDKAVAAIVNDYYYSEIWAVRRLYLEELLLETGAKIERLGHIYKSKRI